MRSSARLRIRGLTAVSLRSAVRLAAARHADLSPRGAPGTKVLAGTIAEMYRGTMSFLKRNLRHVQAGQGFNSLGILEVPEEALQELVVNMFMHRDYFVESPWRVFIFDDRIEIISPGCLDCPSVLRGVGGASSDRPPKEKTVGK